MSKISHFFNLNCFLKTNQQAWVVDKHNPNVPLMKISTSQFKLIKSGIFKKKGNKIEFNNETFYLSDELMNKFKLLSLKNKCNISDLVISLQEFLNKEVIDDLNLDINLEPIKNIINKMDDVYIICPKNSQRVMTKFIDNLKEKLIENGLRIKDFYYLNENFLNRDSDEVKFKEMRLLLQHFIGYKTDNDKFIDTELEKYDYINFYDTSSSTLLMTNHINSLLQNILNKTDKGLRDVIKEDLKDSRCYLLVNKIESNDVNPMTTKKIRISLNSYIKTWESFSISL